MVSCCAEEPDLFKALIGHKTINVALSVGVPFSQFSSYGVSLHLFMAQVIGQGTGRHAEDEENDVMLFFF